MASATGIRAGAAYVELLVNNSALVRGLRAASAKLRAFGATISTMGMGLMMAGAAVVTPLLSSVKAFADTGDKLDEMSARTGVSVEALSEFEHAANVSGTSLDVVEASLRKMQASIVKAGDGSKQSTEAFARLGLGVKQLQGLAPEDQFALIAQRLTEIKDPTDRAAIAMQVFGRSGTALLPMMKDLPALRDEARKLGLVWSTEDARAAGVLSDAMTTLWASMKRIITTIGAALAPFATELVRDFQEIAVATQQWLSRNRGLVVSALKLGAILVGVGAALFVVGKAFVFVAAIVGGIATVFGAMASLVTGLIGGIGTIVSVVSAVAGAVGTAFSAIGAAIAAVGWPVLVVIGVLAALAAYALYASGLLEKAWTAAVGAVADATAWLQERFAELKEFATTTFKGIADALAAGDVALAARIMWLSIQVAWYKGVAGLKSVWFGLKDWFLKTTNDMLYGAAAMVANVFYDLQATWASTVNFWADALGSFASFFKRTWNEITGWAAKLWTKVLSVVDSSINVEAVNKEIDRDTGRQNQAISRQTLDARLGRAQDVQRIEQERRGVLTALALEADKEERTQRERHAQELGDAEKALDEARNEWLGAIVEAGQKRREVEAAVPPAARKLPETALPAVEQAAQKFDVIGTFSALATFGMGVGGSAAERTAKASEETARNTKRILDEVQSGEAAFD